MGRIRVLTTALAVLAEVALAACSGSGSVGPKGDSQGVGMLPPIPASRGASILTETLLSGSDVYQLSTGATVRGTALSLVSVAGGFEWGMYRFNVGTQTLDSVAVVLTLPQGESAWIALSDYAAHRWRVNGPYAASKTLALDDGQYTSASGDLYVVVVVSGGSSATVQQLSLRTVRPPSQPPTAVLTATPAFGDAPLTAWFDASGSTDPDGSIVKYEWDFDGDGAWDAYGESSTAQHGYGTPGAWKARVRVTDDGGACSIAQTPVRANEVFANPNPWPMYDHDPRCTRRSAYVAAQTNHVKWTYPVDMSGSPAVASDGTVYVSAVDVAAGFYRTLYAINPDGSFKWSYPMGDWIGYPSPAIAVDGTIYCRSSENPYLQALYPDGSPKWTAEAPGNAPLVGADGMIYVGGAMAPELYAVSPDGSVKWYFDKPGGDWCDVYPSIAADGTAYVTDLTGTLYALDY